MTPQEIDARMMAFLKEYKAWAEKDAPRHKCFVTCVGLCSNLQEYTEEIANVGGWERGGVMRRFRNLLGDEEYPFGYRAYSDDTDNQAHHRNEDRMAWVNAQIERMEK